jgi:flagellin
MNIGIVSNLLRENSINNNKTLGNSLEKLSTGLKINKAADNASGLSISDKLRTQASGIKQGIDNANSAIAMMNIADKAMTELSNILDTIKSKAIQMNTDTTSEDGRKIIKTDILKLIESYDDIVCRTNYNQTPLLSGCSSPFDFQVGDNSDDIISVNIDSVDSRQMGEADPYKLKNFITGFKPTPELSPTLPSVQSPPIIGGGSSGIQLNSDINDLVGYSSNTAGKFMIEIPAGIEDLTLYLNEYYQDDTFQVFTKDGKHIAGTPLGDSSWQAPNSPSLIVDNNLGTYFNLTATYQNELASPSIPNEYYGPYNSSNGNSNSPSSSVNVNYLDKYGDTINKTIHENEELIIIPNVTEDLVVFVNGIGSYQVSAEWKYIATPQAVPPTPSSTDVDCSCESSTLIRSDIDPVLKIQAQNLMLVLDEALNQLNSQRGNVGAGTNQLESSARNHLSSYVNIKNAESIIRDVSYEEESSNFNKANIISQAGSYVQSQANEIDKQSVAQLLK